MSEIERVAVLGAGSWGTALAKLVADKGYSTHLWARRSAIAEAIERERENQAYLPGFELPKRLHATSDIREALKNADLVLCAIPTHGLRAVLSDAASAFSQGIPIVSAIKGIENESLKLISEVFEEILPQPLHAQLAHIGGPSFAKEVAAGAPTAICIAGNSSETLTKVQQALTTDRFRVYTTDDVVGVELGGAIKNVIAIAAGIADGLELGHNTRAGLITRGLAEISRLAIAKGANPLTLAGLSGMGDLVLTCTGELSRNREVGIQLGRGKSLDEILEGMNMIAEGVRTARSVKQLAQRDKIDMPICEQVHAVLYENVSPRDAVVDLMTRPPRPERE